MDAEELPHLAFLLAKDFADPSLREKVEWLFDGAPAVLRLYRLVVADPAWDPDADAVTRTRLVLAPLRRDRELLRAFEADVDAGRLGLGAGDEDPDEAATVAAVMRDWHGAKARPPETAAEAPMVEALPPGTAEALPPETAEALPPPPAEADLLPPADVPLPATTVKTWMNARIDDPGAAGLVAGHRYHLGVSLGEREDAALGGTSALTGVVIPEGEEQIDLDVHLMSAEFKVPAKGQTLTLRRDGTSAKRLRFAVTPLADGPATLTVVLRYRGNFVQQIAMRFDIGSGSAEPVDAANYGRPLGDTSAALGERSRAMRFTPEDGGYMVEVDGVTPAGGVRISLTIDDLAASIGKVRAALDDVTGSDVFQAGLTIDDDSAAGALRLLARAGRLLYQDLFEGYFATAGLQGVGDWLRKGDGGTLQIVSKNLPVPWGLVYLGESMKPEDLDWGLFVGMRYVIEDLPMERDLLPVQPPATIEVTPSLPVRTLFNDTLDATMPSKPISAQRAFWQRYDASVTLAEGSTTQDALAAVAGSPADRIVYLLCHAVAKDDDGTWDPKFLLTDDAVTLDDMRLESSPATPLAAQPLVVINACDSGDLTPEFYAGWVNYFLSKGARGVIGTEAKVPSVFASEWGTAFFGRFLGGERLGDAVLGLRQQFLAEHKNPLGLLYGVHADTDVHLDHALAAAGAKP